MSEQQDERPEVFAPGAFDGLDGTEVPLKGPDGQQIGTATVHSDDPGCSRAGPDAPGGHDVSVLPPGTWDPAYGDSLRDWLNHTRGWQGHGYDQVIIPTTPRAMTRPHLTRRKAWGPAPYVGPPFVYCWYVAVDGVGAQVLSGDAWIQYTSLEEKT